MQGPSGGKTGPTEDHFDKPLVQRGVSGDKN